jgi:hypothetical protein
MSVAMLARLARAVETRRRIGEAVARWSAVSFA